MQNFLTRYRHISLLFIFLLISITLLSLNRPMMLKPSNILERVVLVIMEPLQRVVSGTIVYGQNIWHNYLALVNLAQENEQLRARIQELEAEKVQFLENVLAYERLEGVLKLAEDRRFTTILARVIGVDPTNQANTVVINRGAEHGVKESWPVITKDGIVGVTVSVGKRSSKVLLLIDPNCNVAALIQRTRDQGVVGGQAKRDAYMMKYVNRRADIRAGEIYHFTPQTLIALANADIPGYILNAEAFLKLQENNIPADILIVLEELRDRSFANQETFIRALEKTIGKEQANWYKPLILPIAQTDVLAALPSLKNQLYSSEPELVKTLEVLLGPEKTAKYKALIMKYAREEETIVSSGLGGIFPKGLMIGSVSKVQKQDYGLFQDIEVRPSVDFSKLEEVLIIQRDHTTEPTE